jgi:cob(I)alamin adenosyltransferase
MSSIATMRGDGGETALVGGVRVSKSSTRVEAYGNVDELSAQLGFARSICEDAALADLVHGIQRDLFVVGAVLATAPSSPRKPEPLATALVDRLTAEVHRLEAVDGMLSDWALPGGHRGAAAFDVARTVCRRAERATVRVIETGEAVQPEVVAYLNRLSDLLWLMGRKLELDAGVNASVRTETGRTGNRWSRAW